MIHQFRQYWIAATIAHQERNGQGADKSTSSGAEANNVVFQILASDAQELSSTPKDRRHCGEDEHP
jgi:hypothetical protein